MKTLSHQTNAGKIKWEIQKKNYEKMNVENEEK